MAEFVEFVVMVKGGNGRFRNAQVPHSPPDW
jgi:hypothetical protein